QGIDTLLEDLNKKPDYGVGFLNKYFNTIFRGMRFGKLMIKSAGTGIGKTRTALADIAAVSATHIWDMEKSQYIKQENIHHSSFISTEIEVKQLQSCLLAIISGVNEGVIKNGNYSKEVYDRLQKGIQIIKNSPITLHYINDFSILDIENIIEQDILESDSKFIFFD
ncbi:DnaB-like helicase C-terminal domain-containing protein, partial [Cetobacterium sp.]|uniref:DnaB-like helicase C-terminal domain-containing protein n=1 Tax=Cetobacterium sp. TaxID=2071632 RepID=UPI003EE4DDEF